MENRALLLAAVFLGGVTVLLLVVDAVTGSIDARRARDDDELDALSERRIRDLVWTIAITAVLAVGAAFTVDSIIRSTVNVHGNLSAVLGLLVATSGVVFVVGVIGALAAVRRERPSYARIRRDLRDRESLSMEPAELRAYQLRLARADRTRERRYSTSSLLRVVGLVIVLAVGVGTVAMTGAGDVRLIVVGVVEVVLAIAAFVVALRAAEVRQAATESVLTTQRAEVAGLLERAKIPPRARVPGLSRRVSRALAILREQQK
jgi:energy-coupling factor transporter transmembrane protein EcfT